MRSTTHVFEAVALVVLQQPVPRAEVPLAEAAIADDALRRRAALLEIAPDLLLRPVGWFRWVFLGLCGG